MIRIIDKRATGKTSRLFMLAKETGAKIACVNPMAMRERAEAYGIYGIEFISYHTLMLMGSKHGDVYIDELESFVKWCLLSNANLLGYSLSVED